MKYFCRRPFANDLKRRGLKRRAGEISVVGGTSEAYQFREDRDLEITTPRERILESWVAGVNRTAGLAPAGNFHVRPGNFQAAASRPLRNAERRRQFLILFLFLRGEGPRFARVYSPTGPAACSLPSIPGAEASGRSSELLLTTCSSSSSWRSSDAGVSVFSFHRVPISPSLFSLAAYRNNRR